MKRNANRACIFEVKILLNTSRRKLFGPFPCYMRPNSAFSNTSYIFWILNHCYDALARHDALDGEHVHLATCLCPSSHGQQKAPQKPTSLSSKGTISIYFRGYYQFRRGPGHCANKVIATFHMPPITEARLFSKSNEITTDRLPSAGGFTLLRKP